MNPRRIQMSRRHRWQTDPPAVIVARPSVWGNPFPVEDHGREEAVAKYRAALEADQVLATKAQVELAGKNLACWCPPGDPCHGDVLLEFANRPIPGASPGPITAVEIGMIFGLPAAEIQQAARAAIGGDR